MTGTTGEYEILTAILAALPEPRTSRDRLVVLVATELGLPNPERLSALDVGMIAIERIEDRPEVWEDLAEYAHGLSAKQQSSVINDAMEHRLAARGIGRHPHRGRPSTVEDVDKVPF